MKVLIADGVSQTAVDILKDDFEYNSGTNPDFLTVEELRGMNP